MLSHVRAVSGDYEQLFWNATKWFDTGISYNKKTRSGFVVSYFYEKRPEGASIGYDRFPDHGKILVYKGVAGLGEGAVVLSTPLLSKIIGQSTNQQ